MSVSSVVLRLQGDVLDEMLKLEGCDLPGTKLPLTEEQREQLTKVYDELGSIVKSLALQRIPLGFLQVVVVAEVEVVRASSSSSSSSSAGERTFWC